MQPEKRHFVVYYSPGTFVPEITSVEIPQWSVLEAKKGAKNIVERYGATPYAFRFETRKRLDWEIVVDKRSPMYWLGGTVRTAEEVLAGTNPKEETLRGNVRRNGYKRVIETRHGTLPLADEDKVLAYEKNM